MKKYVKNKYFIPYEFIEVQNNKSNNNIEKLIGILIIINIFIIPTSFNKVLKKINNNEIVPVASAIENNQDINKEKISTIIKAISENIISLKIENDSGSIELNSIQEIYSIEEKEIFKINSLNIDAKDRYHIEVGL
ncbi:hypothetical protein ACQPVP_09370 [Clostridium nigeriense]|uniref:hypothetical protein n=1 Tax=Clostridium nigeriense TaxID=1805470 RepID=UPI003D34B9D7